MKKWTKEEKTVVVLEMIRGQKSVAQICKEYGIHENVAYKWRDQALKGMEEALSDKRKTRYQTPEAEKERLLKIIGHQACVIDMQKKISEML
jgi:transposase-like protein